MRNEICGGYKNNSGSQIIAAGGSGAQYKDLAVALDVPQGHIALVWLWADLRGSAGGNCRIDIWIDGAFPPNQSFVYSQVNAIQPNMTVNRVGPGKHFIQAWASNSGGSCSVESASLTWLIVPAGGVAK